MFYLFISLIGSVIASIAYKASTEMGCRRMQHLLVERSILVAGFACVGSALGGMALTVDVILLAVVAGISLFVARWGLLKALSTGHAGVTYTFWNLSLVIPVLLCIFLWEEVPTAWQIIGLVLVPASLLLLRERVTPEMSPQRDLSRWATIYPTLLCLGGEGIFSSCFKMMDVRGLEASRNLFLILFNIVAVIAIVSTTYLQGWSLPRKREYLAGAWSGLAFTFTGTFGILAVLQLPGIIFFPVASAGALLLTLLCTHLLWREKTSTAQKLGIALTVVVIVLVSSAGDVD
jgi:drug/metabolite transporter (DMT)-like permease